MTSMGNIASTYRNQGRWKEANELAVQVMKTQKRVPGQEHLDMLTSTTNVAFTWNSQGAATIKIGLMKECSLLTEWRAGNAALASPIFIQF